MSDSGSHVMSRRDAIVGALALAAGTLIASKPEVALGANLQTLTTAGIFYTSAETIIYLSPTASDTTAPISSAIFNRFGFNSGGFVEGVSGVVSAGAAAGSSGVSGASWISNGIGVKAQNYQGAGTALKVLGKAQFSRSGKRTIPKGKSSLTLTGLAHIETTSMILVTLQGSGGSSVYLKYARRMSDSSFKVVLSRACTSAVSFAWMIVD